MANGRTLNWRLYAVAVLYAFLASSSIYGDSSNVVIHVSTATALQSEVQNVSSNTTILIEPGADRLSLALVSNGAFSNVTIRGEGATHDDVVLVGPGMTHASYGDVPYGIATGGGVDGVTISNLTIRDVYTYAIGF